MPTITPDATSYAPAATVHYKITGLKPNESVVVTPANGTTWPYAAVGTTQAPDLADASGTVNQTGTNVQIAGSATPGQAFLVVRDAYDSTIATICSAAITIGTGGGTTPPTGGTGLTTTEIALIAIGIIIVAVVLFLR